MFWSSSNIWYARQPRYFVHTSWIRMVGTLYSLPIHDWQEKRWSVCLHPSSINMSSQTFTIHTEWFFRIRNYMQRKFNLIMCCRKRPNACEYGYCILLYPWSGFPYKFLLLYFHSIQLNTVNTYHIWRSNVWNINYCHITYEYIIENIKLVELVRPFSLHSCVRLINTFCCSVWHSVGQNNDVACVVVPCHNYRRQTVIVNVMSPPFAVVIVHCSALAHTIHALYDVIN